MASIWCTRLESLGGPTVWLVGRLLALFVPHVVSDSANYSVGTPEFTVEIGPPAQVMKGLGLLSVFLGLAMWAFRDRLRFPRAWLLFPVGLTAMWLANGIRLAALVLIGTWWSEGLGVSGFHSQAGWLAFIIVGSEYPCSHCIVVGSCAEATRLPFPTETTIRLPRISSPYWQSWRQRWSSAPSPKVKRGVLILCESLWLL